MQFAKVIPSSKIAFVDFLKFNQLTIQWFLRYLDTFHDKNSNHRIKNLSVNKKVTSPELFLGWKKFVRNEKLIN